MSASGHSRVAAMFSLVVACAAGCQDSERDSSASFRSKTNAICKTQRAELEAAEAKSRIGINAQVIALMRRHLDELRRQEPPASIAARMKHWLTAGDQLIGILLRQNRVLTRDLVRVDAAMRRGARKPRRKHASGFAGASEKGWSGLLIWTTCRSSSSRIRPLSSRTSATPFIFRQRPRPHFF